MKKIEFHGDRDASPIIGDPAGRGLRYRQIVGDLNEGDYRCTPIYTELNGETNRGQLCLQIEEPEGTIPVEDFLKTHAFIKSVEIAPADRPDVHYIAIIIVPERRRIGRQ